MVISFKEVKKYHSSFPKKPTIASSFHASISSRGDNRAILCSASVVLIIIAAIFLCPPIFTNDDPSNALTGTSIASDTTLSISLSGSVLPLDITPTSSAGTFASTVSGDTHATIRVATNNITGYTIGIKASNPNSSTADKLISDNEQCENTPTSAKCAINSLPQPVTEAQYIDNAMEGVDLNNTWGYLPSKYNSEDNTNYLPAPVSGDTIATTDSPNPENTTTNDGTLQSDEYTIDYGMRIDYSPYAGTYSTNYNNQSYIITAVGNPVPYSVSYNANKPEQAPATSTVDNVPSAQTGTVSGGTTVAVILSSKVPTIGITNPSTEDYTYAGYVFNGWCTVQPQEDQTTGYQTCPNDADIYQPGDNFGIDQTVDNTQTLYATWGAPAKITFNANGLIYNNTPGDIVNTVDYIPTYEGNIITGTKTNTIYTGTYKTPAHAETTPATNYILKGWSIDPNATEATYADEQAIINDLTLNADDNITLYAIWTYTTIITFDKNGADSTETMAPQVVEANTTVSLDQNTYTNTGYVLGSWNIAADGSGTSYEDEDNFTAPPESKNITLYAQWEEPCDANSICYRPNGANEGQNDPKMGVQTTNYSDNTNPITSNMEVSLWSSNYKYDTNNDGYNDYGFAGWSRDRNAASKMLDTNPDNNPTIYGPNQTITLGKVSKHGLNLYAVWLPVAKSNTVTDLTFQTANLLTTTLADGSTLASKPNGYVTALKDQRDNQVYAVAKLADGNYWMIENLRLNNDPDQPNWGDNALSQGFGGAFIGLANAESTNFGSATANSLYNTGSSRTMPRYNNTNTTFPIANMTVYDNNTNVYSLGNYYSWAAAIADTTAYTYTNVATSICPAGWRLPYGGSGTSGSDIGNTKGGFYYLGDKIGGTSDSADSSKAWRSFPNNFIYSGYWNESSARNRSYYSFYWSSTAIDTIHAYSLYFESDDVDPGIYNDDYFYGNSVRCISNQ